MIIALMLQAKNKQQPLLIQGVTAYLQKTHTRGISDQILFNTNTEKEEQVEIKLTESIYLKAPALQDIQSQKEKKQQLIAQIKTRQNLLGTNFTSYAIQLYKDRLMELLPECSPQEETQIYELCRRIDIDKQLQQAATAQTREQMIHQIAKIQQELQEIQAQEDQNEQKTKTSAKEDQNEQKTKTPEEIYLVESVVIKPSIPGAQQKPKEPIVEKIKEKPQTEFNNSTSDIDKEISALSLWLENIDGPAFRLLCIKNTKTKEQLIQTIQDEILKLKQQQQDKILLQKRYEAAKAPQQPIKQSIQIKPIQPQQPIQAKPIQPIQNKISELKQQQQDKILLQKRYEAAKVPQQPINQPIQAKPTQPVVNQLTKPIVEKIKENPQTKPSYDVDRIISIFNPTSDINSTISMLSFWLANPDIPYFQLILTTSGQTKDQLMQAMQNKVSELIKQQQDKILLQKRYEAAKVPQQPIINQPIQNKPVQLVQPLTQNKPNQIQTPQLLIQNKPSPIQPIQNKLTQPLIQNKPEQPLAQNKQIQPTQPQQYVLPIQVKPTKPQSILNQPIQAKPTQQLPQTQKTVAELSGGLSLDEKTTEFLLNNQNGSLFQIFLKKSGKTKAELVQILQNESKKQKQSKLGQIQQQQQTSIATATTATTKGSISNKYL